MTYDHDDYVPAVFFSFQNYGDGYGFTLVTELETETGARYPHIWSRVAGSPWRRPGHMHHQFDVRDFPAGMDEFAGFCHAMYLLMQDVPHVTRSESVWVRALLGAGSSMEAFTYMHMLGKRAGMQMLSGGRGMFKGHPEKFRKPAAS